MSDIKKFFAPAIAVGAIWGIFEATAGYLLHLLPAGSMGWLIWFPAAAFFMATAYKLTGKPSAMIVAAVTAALIKLVDFGLPGMADRVINPAVSIVLEALALYAAVRLLNGRPFVTAAIAAGFGWRVLYIFYISTMPQWMIATSPARDPGALAAFLLAEPAVNAAVIGILSPVMHAARRFSVKIPTAVPIAALCAAAAIQRLL